MKEPEDFSAKTEKDVLKYALGAFLYVPATPGAYTHMTLPTNRDI
ncbi:HpcH/HpaI aldolase/citrate lyase family protein [Clostridioides difficile]|nr:HpcH/HpaI aldolase/citrate lyase family protein [Clostridioides difficile]